MNTRQLLAEEYMYKRQTSNGGTAMVSKSTSIMFYNAGCAADIQIIRWRCQY